MGSIDYWQVIHKYMRLVAENRALPLMCPECEERLRLRMGPGDRPMLWCMTCDAKYVPGMDVWDQIRAVVSEWHV